MGCVENLMCKRGLRATWSLKHIIFRVTGELRRLTFGDALYECC